jgi:hypothetical protein
MKIVNKTTGKESTRSTDFNQTNWGAVTSGYITSIGKSLASDSKFDALVANAKSFAKVNQRDRTTTSPMIEQEFDERAELCDDESDDE